MNFVIGFGSTETELEAKEEKAIVAHVTEEYGRQKLSYFTPEFSKQMLEWIEKRAKETQAQSAKFRKAEDHPDRYSSYWVSMAEGASDLVFIARFLHVNRRHAFSPDGWASLATTRLIHISALDLPRGE